MPTSGKQFSKSSGNLEQTDDLTIRCWCYTKEGYVFPITTTLTITHSFFQIMFPSSFTRHVPFFLNSKCGNSCFQGFPAFRGHNTSIPKQLPQWQESSKGERWLDFWWSTTKPSLVKVVEVQPIENRLLLKPPVGQNWLDEQGLFWMVWDLTSYKYSFSREMFCRFSNFFLEL